MDMISLSLLGIGLWFVVLGCVFVFLYYHKLKRCTETVEGSVVQYNYSGSGPRPVIQYWVKGIYFHRCKNYRGIIKVTSSGQKETCLRVDEKERLHIRGNTHFMDFRKPIAELYPLGTIMTVYYNPDSPGDSYVTPYVAPYKLVGGILGIIGLIFLIISCVTYF